MTRRTVIAPQLIRTAFSLAIAGLLAFLLAVGVGGFYPRAAQAAGEVCFVETTGDSTTDYSSTDASAVQDAIDAASPGDTLKIAGTCVGVIETEGISQTAYISKNLTLRGGYTPTNWLAASDSATYPTILDAQNSGRVVYLTNNAVAALFHLTLRNGQAGSDFGGAIYATSNTNLSFDNGRIEDNEADLGGAIFHSGPVTIRESTLSGNSAGSGGAIYINGPILTIADSTLVNNSATTSNGGAIYSDGTLNITNSTFSDNHADAGNGGAIAASNPTSANISYSTFSGNSAGTGGGVYGKNSMTLSANIIANSPSGGDCAWVASAIIDGGYNLIEDGSCITAGTSLSGDPGLQSLANNGGPATGAGQTTWTYALLNSSPALDLIPNGTNGCGLTIDHDQRGESRPVGTGCEPGAFENDRPVAMGDTYPTDEDSPLSIAAPGVLANDNDVDMDGPLSAALQTGPTHGALTLASNGSFVYTPTLNFFGTDNFTYIATDGMLTDAAVVTISIASVNDWPVANGDSYPTDEDTPLSVAAPGVLVNDTDVDSTLSAAVQTGPAHGTLTLNSNGSFVYTPTLNFFGTDGFLYAATDGILSDTAAVTITIAPVNDRPVTVDEMYTTNEDTPLSVAAPGVLANDTDLEDSLSAVLQSGPDHGVLTLSSNGSFIYTPTLNYYGSDGFLYTATDGVLDDTAVVTLTITPVNDPPVAVADERYVPSDEQSTIDVLSNDTDIDSDTLTLTDVSNPASGSAVIDGNRILYTPDASTPGIVVTFSYTVSDGQIDDTAPVTVTTYQTNINVACTSPADLIAAINEANLVPAIDTITLAAGCVYTLTTYTDFNPDGYGPVGLPPITSPLTIEGNGATILRDENAADTFRLLYVTDSGNLTLNEVILRGGIAKGGNGAKSQGISGEGRGGRGGGAAGLGGAIFNRGQLTVTRSTLADNQAIGGSDGIILGGPTHAGGGGGGMAASAVNKNGGAGGGGNGGSSVNGSNGGFGGGGGGGGYNGSNGRNGGNGGFGGGGGGASGYDGGTAGTGGVGGFGGGNGGNGSARGRGGGGAGMGGAIFNMAGTLSLVNSTLTGNSAQGGDGLNGQDGDGLGGAIFNMAGTVEIVHSTLADNLIAGQSPEGRAIYNYQNGGTITVQYSVLADNSGGNSDCFNNSGVVTSVNTLIEDGTCGATFSGDPLLGPLGTYEGGTETYALLSGSQAIDAIPSENCLLNQDQRGFSRPQVGGCDIGAFEGQGVVLSISGGDNQTAYVNKGFGQPLTVTLSAAISSEPVIGITTVVTFAGPESGARIIPAVVTATLDSSLLASAVVTANAVVGSYVVTATATGIITPVIFSLTNACHPSPVVSNGNDSGSGSLRQAVYDACEGATITFDDDYAIYMDSTLYISKKVAIDGQTNQITLSGDSGNDGDRNVRVLRVAATGVVTVSHVTITRGRVNYGAGIYNEGSLVLADSTVTDNLANSHGGGIRNDGTLSIINSTLYGNRVNSAGSMGKDGGGIFNSGSGAVLTVLNSTFAANIATSGAAIFASGGTVHLSNSLLANSDNRNDCIMYGTLATNQNNLIEDGSCSPALSANPRLSSFGNYGGSTSTLALLPGSPAIDGGNGGVCPATDQRGASRPIVNGCDIGAFESQGFAVTVSDGDNQSTLVGTAFSQPLAVTVTAAVSLEPVGPGGLVNFTGPDSGAGLNPITVAAATDASGSVTNTVTANSLVGSYPVTATASGVITPANFTLENFDIPDLSLSKSIHSGLFAPDAIITYTLGFANSRQETAHNVVITDSLPASITVLSVSSSGDVAITRTLSNQNFEVFETSAVAPGQSGQITLTAKIDSRVSAGQRLTNTATITAFQEYDPSDNRAEVGIEIGACFVSLNESGVTQ